jgi:2,4-diketo-3-deoxy-L-fuconate hydrolase
MRFARVGAAGQEIPVVAATDGYYDLRPLTADIDPDFLAAGGLDQARERFEAGDLAKLDVDPDGIRIGSPVRRPGAIVCVGMNYAAHAAESGSAPPEVPIIFLKTPNTVVGPYNDVAIPRGSTRTDWEVEMGVVIGRRALYLDDPAESLDCVAGFVTANDLSERSFQLTDSGGQWSKGKCAPGFSPLGPWLVTPDEVDHQSLALRSWVNGEPRQDSYTKDQIFDVAMVIHHLSQYLALDPGDVILTGTPEGVALSGRFPYLAEGDVVEVEVDGLGRQRQQLVSYLRAAR